MALECVLHWFYCVVHVVDFYRSSTVPNVGHKVTPQLYRYCEDYSLLQVKAGISGCLELGEMHEIEELDIVSL